MTPDAARLVTLPLNSQVILGLQRSEGCAAASADPMEHPNILSFGLGQARGSPRQPGLRGLTGPAAFHALGAEAPFVLPHGVGKQICQPLGGERVEAEEVA